MCILTTRWSTTTFTSTTSITGTSTNRQHRSASRIPIPIGTLHSRTTIPTCRTRITVIGIERNRRTLSRNPPRDCDFQHAVEDLTCCALDQNVVQPGRIVAPLDMTYTVTEGASILAVDSPAPLGILVHCRDYLNDYEFGRTMPVFVGAGAHELTVVARDRAHNAAPAVMLSFTADCDPSPPDAGSATSSPSSGDCSVAGGPGGAVIVLLTLLAARPLPRSSRPAPPRRTCRR